MKEIIAKNLLNLEKEQNIQIHMGKGMPAYFINKSYTKTYYSETLRQTFCKTTLTISR